MSEKNVILFALCICAKDGLISEIEENELFDSFNEYVKEKKLPFEKLTKTKYEEIVVEFFNSTRQLEDYVQDIEELEYLEEVLKLAETAASSDGFDIQENIAFKKTLQIIEAL